MKNERLIHVARMAIEISKTDMLDQMQVIMLSVHLANLGLMAKLALEEAGYEPEKADSSGE